MKSIFYLSVIIGFGLILIQFSSFCQSPEAIKYQTIVRDTGGNILSNQSVSFRLSILQGGHLGTTVYCEIHLKTTNQFGLATLEIGEGMVVSGDFAAINWGNDSYYLQMEVDPAGGTSWILMGTSQFLSVPYALYSKKSGNDLPSGAAGQTLRNDGTTWVPSSILYDDGERVGVGTQTPYPSAALEVASPLTSTPKVFSLPGWLTKTAVSSLTRLRV
ncbi:MAG: hypothetical protein NTU44_04465 [Bacteroidetes bacterium]|nr:hypothetical protein [Bacteroidota bacterium]